MLHVRLHLPPATRMLYLVLVALICSVPSCGQYEETSISWTAISGGLYSVRDEDGSFRIAKVLATDDSGVHARLFSNRFADRPRSGDTHLLFMTGIRTDSASFGIGHIPLTHRAWTTWDPQLISHDSVSDSELEGYDIWLHSSGSYYGD